jgi:hypothetical protein
MTIKFNGGNPVVLCDKCRKIIRSATENDFKNRYNINSYCDECKD